MNIIGISALYHDSAACLLSNGKLIAAAQEERFTRLKHDSSFPVKAIEFCLKQSDLEINDIDLVVYYEKPFLKFDRIINSLQYETPFGFSFFRKSITAWTKTKLWIPSLIKSKLNYSGKVIFSEHHEAHASASFFSSPYKESVILTIDGVGEKACTTIAIGKENKVTILKEQHYPHSLGLLYSAFTQYCGFMVNSGEYKLMGLAPYGKPKYKQLILDNIVSYTAEGIITLNMSFFAFERGKSTINKAFCELLGRDARLPEDEMDVFYCDMASSIQAITEDIVICLAKYAKQITGLDSLCLSGGVALNCKANGELLKQNVFKDIWVQPASGDSGCAIGAAYVGWHHYLKRERVVLKNSLKDQVYLGSSYSYIEIETLLKHYNLKFRKVDSNTQNEIVSDSLLNKKIVGWFKGRMEFGPRALGHRSILANPLFEDMKHHVNLNIKKREGFRPFAPIVMEEHAKEWFENCDTSKYMVFIYEGNREKKIPSCIHEDGTARVQTLAKADNENLHDLMNHFYSKTNCPVLINTSFNVRGEPIVESPLDSLKCFFQTGMDILVLESYIISKSDNKNVSEELTKVMNYAMD
ncbi:carbamoyltransferase N-terminal domain-containing protein [Winogradskyella sp.]|uniref:carbamoyltransferase family protein n=1 Tax=Winogradskyella sp. TaxID=1883156 RepID=UPI0025F59D0C|nr:carbamoyltransferase N-terminal domain-containing protein [Winogradskyella sp.]